jgi:hypothetical protein
MNKNYLKVMVVVTAAALLTSISVRAAETEYEHQVSGEITWIDLPLGKLQLKNDTSARPGEITEYRITANETRVTDPTDKKLLTVEDLQPGQHVKVDLIYGKEENIVKKITADPRPTSEYQEAYGEIEAIDVGAGTFSLAGRQRTGETGKSGPSYFVFDPKNIRVMQSPSTQPVQFVLKPGDVVKVEYAVKDEKQWAHSITLYSPTVTSTTTTTTVTTTR